MKIESGLASTREAAFACRTETEKSEKPPPSDCRRSCCGGCILGPLLLFAGVAVTNDAPDFGGILLLPLCMFVGAILTWIGIVIYDIWQQYQKRKK